MKLKLGDKVRGFKFLNTNVGYAKEMDIFIGKVGTIIDLRHDRFLLKFKGEIISWYYPLDHPQAKRISSLKNKLK